MSDTDIDMLRHQAHESTKKMHIAYSQIETYEKRIEALLTECNLFKKLASEADQDRNQMRAIMTQNIVESNAKMNMYLEDITVLQSKLNELKI